MKDSFETEFSRFVRARFKVFVVSTFEEGRAINHMKNACDNKDLADIAVWDIAKGTTLLKRADEAQKTAVPSTVAVGAGANPSHSTYPPSTGVDPKSTVPDGHQGAGNYDPIDLLAAVENLPPRSKPLVIVLKDFHEFWLQAPLVRRQLRNASQVLPDGITIVITTSEKQIPKELRDDVPVIDLSLPNESYLRGVFDSVIKEFNVQVDMEEPETQKMVQAALGLSAAQAGQVFRKAALKGLKLDSSRLQIIIEEKQRVIRQSEALEFYPVTQSFEDIGGLERLKDWLKKRKDAFGEEAKNYELPPPKGIALIGIPGTGKSLTAKTVGHLWRLPLLRLDIGALFGGLVGESEDNTRRAIQVVNAIAPCVLWIDEIEKAFAGGDHDGGTSSRVFGTILTWMQDKADGVFIVATANDISRLPPELLRKGRFDEIFFLDLPTEEERKKIFEVQLKKRNRLTEDFNLDVLAKASNGLVGAEIEQVIIEALYAGFNDNRRSPRTEDVLEAIRTTVPLAEAEKEKIGALREWLKQGRAVSASVMSKKTAIEQAVNLQTLGISEPLNLIPDEED